MTRIKAKLRRIGNSRGVIIPLEVITGIKLGEEIELDVITEGEKGTEPLPNVITGNKKMIWCRKHNVWERIGECK